MTLEKFINEFSNIFEDTDISILDTNTSYLDLEEWDSMIALATMAHFDEEFGLKIEPTVLFNSNSFKELHQSLFNE